MYCTDLPCHECAKHIVASGIRRLVFIEPYPKSRAFELFDDSIVLGETRDGRVNFVPFVGIAPRRYLVVFVGTDRRDEEDKWLDWDKIRRNQRPRGALDQTAYVDREKLRVFVLDAQLSKAGIRRRKPA